jgi:hypothetical protein
VTAGRAGIIRKGLDTWNDALIEGRGKRLKIALGGPFN